MNKLKDNIDKMDNIQKNKVIAINRNMEIYLIAIIFVLIISNLFILNQSMTGFFVFGQPSYIENVSLSFNQSQVYNHPLAFNPTSLRLSGSVIGDGNANVYLIFDNTRYLVFNSSNLEKEGEGISILTGLVVRNTSLNESVNSTSLSSTATIDEIEEELTALDNETDDVSTDNTTNETTSNETNQTLNQTINVSANVTHNASANITENISLNITGLNATENNITEENVTANITANITENITEEIIENLAPVWLSVIDNITIQTNSNYSINLSAFFSDPNNDSLTYLATGPDNISVFISNDLAILTPGNNFTGERSITFIASDLNLTASSPELPIFVAELNITEENVTNITIIPLTIIEFENICEETCSLTGITENITFEFELINTILNITEFTYTYSEEELELADRPPVFLTIPDQSWWMNSNLTINFSEYSYDPDNDNLTYLATGPENIEVFIYNDIVTLTPDINWFGNETISFIASDLNLSAFSNEVLLEVLENISLNISNHPPEALLMPNITIEKNSEATIDLNDYFSDPDNQTLYYTSTSPDNIAVLILDNEVFLTPDNDFVGTNDIVFTANDSLESVSGNLAYINVIDKARRVNRTERTVQIYAEINKPVRWIKSINLNESIENLTVNITSFARNITVKKIVDDQEFDIDEQNILVIGNQTSQNLDEFEQSNLITGSVIREVEGKGILSRIIEFFSSPEITGRVVQDVALFTNITVNSSSSNETVLLIIDNATEYSIEYITDAPLATETNISATDKRITISSNIPYQNILTYSELNIVAPREAIKVYWWVNESEYNRYNNISIGQSENLNNNSNNASNNNSFNTSNNTSISSIETSSEKTYRMDITDMHEFYIEFYDYDDDNLIDLIEWVTPHLSNQTFEIEINILNVQSYPMVGGEWTVSFTTIGTANLTIYAINQTTYTNLYDYNGDVRDDLEALSLSCGNQTLFDKSRNISSVQIILDNGTFVGLDDTYGQSLDIDSLFVEDYSCNQTSLWTVKVITEGIHNQMFTFGFDIGYANNLAQYAPVTRVIKFADNNLTNSKYFE
ncbi:MAG: Ig-like domain-containing protein [Candidatus Woesearchaeota archaeon]